MPPNIAAIHPDLTANLVVWHRYNVFSIRNRLEWALTPQHPFAPHRLLHIERDYAIDPYAGCRIMLKLAEAERVRRWIDTIISTVRECRIIIVTPGLAEVWQNCETGLAINRAPSWEMWHALPNRFQFSIATCAETLHELNKIYVLLSRHCVEGVQVVVTVSPIPLSATYGELDIVVWCGRGAESPARVAPGQDLGCGARAKQCRDEGNGCGRHNGLTILRGQIARWASGSCP